MNVESKKILFVDDDREFLLGKTVFFQSRGYTVLNAQSASEALELLTHEQPDIIFLDLMMEHSDSGFVLSSRIRKDERFKNTPIVMLSGVASALGRRFDREGSSLQSWSKLDLFLDKPVSGKQLLQIVEERLSAGPSEGHLG